MDKEKTFAKIIEDFLKQVEKAPLCDIYNEVEKNRKKLSKYWKSIVRNKLYFSKKFVKVNKLWELKKEL